MPAADDLSIVLLTLRICALSTLLILPPGLALGLLLARRRFPGKAVVETLVSLPLVLPPVATGLVLLKLLGPHGPLGHTLRDTFHLDIVFTWRAVVVATAVMSIPLLIRSARSAFEAVPHRLEDVARTLGAGEWRVFRTITLPLAARGLLAGTTLAFARAVGEFGATILVAGNIPGKTSTLALSIYQAVQTGDDATAYRLLAIAVAIAFAAVWGSDWLSRRGGGAA